MWSLLIILLSFWVVALITKGGVLAYTLFSLAAVVLVINVVIGRRSLLSR
jgi:hypothetical protein